MRKALVSSLAQFGLTIHGEIGASGNEPWPKIDNRPVKAVLLIGHLGARFWPYFSAWLSRQEAGLQDPLDQWSKALLTKIAADYGATAYFPSDKPYLPFQRWAMQGLGIKQSPLGILIHPEFGLWHGFRGALAFKEWAFLEAPILAHPCDTCIEKPCLSACPVSAFSPDGLNRPKCHDYLTSNEGAESCMQGGCQARNACPIGAEYRYDHAQIQFYMKAYSGSFSAS